MGKGNWQAEYIHEILGASAKKVRRWHLDFEVVRTLVLAFGHVNRNELKGGIFLKETSKNSGDSSGQRRAVNVDRGSGCHWSSSGHWSFCFIFSFSEDG